MNYLFYIMLYLKYKYKKPTFSITKTHLKIPEEIMQ